MSGGPRAAAVNVNKVATLRNSRGGALALPQRRRAASCIAAGAPGITVHPRADERHITRRDVRALAQSARAHPARGRIQHRRRSAAGAAGSGREVRPRPVHAGAGASRRDHEPGGLAAGTPRRRHAPSSWRDLRRPRHARQPVRRSRRRRPMRWAASTGADRVELYTEPFARAFERKRRGLAIAASRAMSKRRNHAHALGLGRQRRPRPRPRQPRRSSATLPYLDEVSIGHALISRALFVGLDRAVREYLAACLVGEHRVQLGGSRGPQRPWNAAMIEVHHHEIRRRRRSASPASCSA